MCSCRLRNPSTLSQDKKLTYNLEKDYFTNLVEQCPMTDFYFGPDLELYCYFRKQCTCSFKKLLTYASLKSCSFLKKSIVKSLVILVM